MFSSQAEITTVNNAIFTQAFQIGMDMGKQRIWRHTQLGIPLCFSRGEQGLVDVIRNLVSYDYDSLPDDLLRQDIGILVGYVLTHPEEFPYVFE